MSFFAGRIGTKTVLSLNSATGGLPADHTNPNTNSIFHSDMPHVYITEKFTIALANSGGYYTGTMPANLQSYLNAGNRVVIPILVFNYNGVQYRKQMTGRHEAVGYNITVGGTAELGRIISNTSGHTYPDLMLEWGTFSRTTAAIEDDIALRGTGGVNCRFLMGVDEDEPSSSVKHNWASGMAAYGPNNASDWVRTTQRFWNPITNSAGYANIRAQEKQNVIDPNWIAPLGPKGGGHNSVFVRADGGRIYNYSQVWMSDAGGDARFRLTRPVGYNDDYGLAEITHLRGGYQAFLSKGYYPSGTSITYAITPVSMEFQVLNLTWTATGGYTATNTFTGADIRISNNTFTIKGQNLLANRFEFLTSVGTGAPGNNANNFFATNNQTAAMNTYPDGGSLGLPGISTAGASVMAVPSAGGTSSSSIPNWKVGTFQFPASGAVLIDSRTNTITIAGKVIWSPSVRPLMLFAANKASNVIIGQNNNLIQLANGANSLLSSVNLGLPAAGNTVVIMSMEYMGVDLHVSGDKQYMAGAGLRYEGAAKRLNRADYEVGDAFQHQIIVLPPNVYVPIFTRRTISFYAGNSSGGYPRSNIVYYMRKNGTTGNLEFYVYSFSTVGWVNAPKFRINVQRLT